jgi:transposase InsO family protein
LLVVDSYSKWPECFPLKTQEAREVATVLFREIFSRYGAPKTLISDRGRNFMSQLVNALCEIFEVKHHYTSAYHPQTNATCERTNSTIEQSIRAYIDEEQNNWPLMKSKITGLVSYRES